MPRSRGGSARTLTAGPDPELNALLSQVGTFCTAGAVRATWLRSVVAAKSEWSRGERCTHIPSPNSTDKVGTTVPILQMKNPRDTKAKSLAQAPGFLEGWDLNW